MNHSNIKPCFDLDKTLNLKNLDFLYSSYQLFTEFTVTNSTLFCDILLVG